MCILTSDVWYLNLHIPGSVFKHQLTCHGLFCSSLLLSLSPELCNHLSVLLIFYVFLWGRGKRSWPIASSCYSFHNRAASRSQCVRVWQSCVVKPGTLQLDFTPLRLTGLSFRYETLLNCFIVLFCFCSHILPGLIGLKGCCELQDFECYIWGQLFSLMWCEAGYFSFFFVNFEKFACCFLYLILLLKLLLYSMHSHKRDWLWFMV